MKRCAMEQNAMAVFDSRTDSVVCPKPRRVGDHFLPFRRYPNNTSEMNDLKAGAELLDIILSKGSGVERSGKQVVASSPPFFSGSPPSRVSNPLVQDEHFGLKKTFKTYSPAPISSVSPSSLGRKGGCARTQKPAAVRIEGFDCLSRDRQNRSISAFA
ncbi:hypothetical protein SOVF_203950 [Spinacia oleracea]|nr:hypothetical protein SOVF_203950 [Spinacia oleracea]